MTKIDPPHVNGSSHATNFSYNYATGDVLTTTDPNSQTISYTYNDPLNRLTQINYPDGGETGYCYTDVGGTYPGGSCSASGVFQVYSGTIATPDPTVTGYTTYDGLGNAIETGVLSAPGGTIITHTSYDGLGQVMSVTNPYQGSPTGYGISYAYDALGRKIQETEQDGSTLAWCYDGLSNAAWSSCPSNQSSVASATWVTSQDEVGHLAQHVSDGLGRLTAVVEQLPSGTNLGLETDYTYNALDDLLSVNQKGVSGVDTARTRQFSYDSLSRLASASNPESGATTYGYLASGSLCAGDATLPCSKTDGRGITTSYQYDALDRLVDKTYSDGTPSDCYVYDSATNGVGRLASEWTQAGTTCPTSWSSASSIALTARNVLTYDPLGRVQTEQQCVLASCTNSSPAFPFTYFYDLAGNTTSATNGVSNTGIQWTYSHDSAGRLQEIDSTWQDGSHPSPLFQASQPLTIGSQTIPAYSPFGLTAAQYGADNSISNIGLADIRSYDNRGRLLTKNVYGAGALQPTTVTFSTTPSTFTTADSPTVAIHVSCNTACGPVALQIDGHDWIPGYDVDGSGNLGNGYNVWYWTNPYLTVGTHTITATYLGNETYAPSSASIPITIVRIGTQSTSVALSVTPTAFTTVENAVVDAQVGCNTACGQVLFSIDGNQWVAWSTDSNGDASIDTYWWLPSLSPGTHTLTANYLGDATYAPASASTSFTINQVGTQSSSVSLTALPGTTFSTSDQFSFVMYAGCGSTCSGSIMQFYVDGSLWLLGQIDQNGKYELDEVWTGFGPFTPGTHTVTAYYLGNSTYAPSQSNTLTITVTE